MLIGWHMDVLPLDPLRTAATPDRRNFCSDCSSKKHLDFWKLGWKLLKSLAWISSLQHSWEIKATPQLMEEEGNVKRHTRKHCIPLILVNQWVQWEFRRKEERQAKCVPACSVQLKENLRKAYCMLRCTGTNCRENPDVRRNWLSE